MAEIVKFQDTKWRSRGRVKKTLTNTSVSKKELTTINRGRDRRKKPTMTVTVQLEVPGGKRISRSAFIAQAAIAAANALLVADDEQSLHTASPDKAAHHRHPHTAADVI